MINEANLQPVHVVEVNTRNGGRSFWFKGYKERLCDAAFWKKNIVDNPKIIRIESPVAKLCGFKNFAIYVHKKHLKKGTGFYYRLSGESAVMSLIDNNPHLLAKNNGAATFLTIQTDIGLPDWIVEGKVYIVCDEGRYPLSKGQVWGIQQMIRCSMDTYDMDPENMRLGQQLLYTWSEEYKLRIWEPQYNNGMFGIDIYGVGQVS